MSIEITSALISACVSIAASVIGYYALKKQHLSNIADKSFTELYSPLFDIFRKHLYKSYDENDDSLQSAITKAKSLINEKSVYASLLLKDFSRNINYTKSRGFKKEMKSLYKEIFERYQETAFASGRPKISILQQLKYKFYTNKGQLLLLRLKFFCGFFYVAFAMFILLGIVLYFLFSL